MIAQRVIFLSEIQSFDIRMLLTIATLLVAIPFCAAGNTTHWSVGNIIIPDSTVRFRLDIYSPTTPGSYPVLVFLTGLSGLIPATFYKTLATTVTEEGVIIIGISKIENFRPEKMAVHLTNFLGWVVKPNDGAARLFDEQKAVQGVIPDVERLGFMSHSAGGHSIIQYLNTTCGPLTLLVMMNPVDGLDPFGLVDDFITRMALFTRLFSSLRRFFLDPPTPLPFRIPTLIISAGYGKVRFPWRRYMFLVTCRQ